MVAPSHADPVAVAGDCPASGGTTEESRWAALINELDLESKVRLLTGASLWTLPAEPRLGLRPVVTSDGPQGVRGTGEVPGDKGLLAPAPSAMGATWDTAVAERLGRLFAEEARRKGVDVVLAPLVNLQRTPVAGRHFECLSEDPLLTGTLAAALVRGLQSDRVAACLKHFVANDSETDRTRYRARIDARTLREVYLAPFERVLAEAGPWSVMGAYSGVDDGTESAPMLEHRRLLRGVLKDEWSYDGAVVSDWAATGNTASTANAGLDLVMPGPDGPWGARLVEAVRRGEVPESVIDDKVLRLMRLAARVGKLGRPWPASEQPALPAGRPVPGPPGEEEFAVLRGTASRGTVLLRDESGLLPLDARCLTSVALIGPNAVQPYLQGGGSAYVPAVRTVGFEEGLRSALPRQVALTVHRGGSSRRHAPFIDPARTTAAGLAIEGVRADYFGPAGEPLGSEVRRTGDWSGFGRVPAGCHRVVLRSVLTLSEPGTHLLEFGCAGRFTVDLDGETVHSGEDDRGVELVLESGHSHPDTHRHTVRVAERERRLDLTVDLCVVHADGYGGFVTAHLRHQPPGLSVEDEIAEAVAAARRADVAVVVVGTNEEVESEGWDRPDLELTAQQHDLVRAVVAANPRTVVVVNAGAPVLLPWAHEVPALLWAWLPGQEAGHALADVLLGRAEPAGRLPWTLPARAEDVPVPDAVPVDGVVEYTDGRHVGHRGYDRAGLVPAFPFGHGLGWTTWSYGGAEVLRTSARADQAASAGGGGLDVGVTIANTGPRAGREVVQAYLETPDDGSDRVVRALAGFTSLEVLAGATATATLSVPLRAFQIWDEEAARWRIRTGRHRLRIGRSSRDLRLGLDLDVRAVDATGDKAVFAPAATVRRSTAAPGPAAGAAETSSPRPSSSA